MFDKLKSLFKSSTEEPNAKDRATMAGEPYVRVLSTNINPEDPTDGYFELEWNEIFIRALLEAGYTGANDEELIDQWFTALCRQIAEEVK